MLPVCDRLIVSASHSGRPASTAGSTIRTHTDGKNRKCQSLTRRASKNSRKTGRTNTACNLKEKAAAMLAMPSAGCPARTSQTLSTAKAV